MGWVVRGRWLVGHVVVVLIAALFIRLGIWQLDRLHQRRAHNRLVEARMRAAAVPAERLPRDPDAARYRAVTATGTYDAGGQVVVRFRSNEGSPGSWIVTPLRLDDGRGVVVLRGWVPEGVTAAAVRPPTGEVWVRGLVDRSQTRGGFGPRDPASGTLRTMARVDVTRLQRQTSYPLEPWFVQLSSQSPPPVNGLPDPLPPPELGEGPHLSYALQWFGFTAIGLVGWPLLVRREAQRRRRRRPQ